MTKEHCINCKFFEPKLGECHVNPPTVIDRDGETNYKYPEVTPKTVACAHHESAKLSMKDAADILSEYNAGHPGTKPITLLDV